MTTNGYYRATLILPLAVPAVALAGLYAFSGGDMPLPAGLEGAVLFLGGSLLIGGIPYAVCAVPLAVAMRSWTDVKIRIASYVVPLGFAIVMGLLGTLGGIEVALMYAFLSVVLGYLYVLLAHAGYAVLRRLGGMDEPIRSSSARSPSRGRSG